MRFLSLVLVTLILGCSSSPTPTPTPERVQISRPLPEPKVDTTFTDQQAVEAWREEIATIIEADIAAPHPREIWRYVNDFHVDRSKPDPILGDPKVWDAAAVARPSFDLLTTPTPVFTADQALALEAQDEEWAAAEMWIVMNRLDDAKRCGTELEKESEWKAVAMIAVHTGDLESLDRATKRMIDADQVSRTRDVAAYAFEAGKTDAAKHIVTAHGWKFSEILNPYQVRELALKGDASILVELLDKEIAAWEKDEYWSLDEYMGPQIIVADIAILAKTDKAKALEYAKRYLVLPYSNVLVWTECGEGCYSRPVAGTLELYQFIRGDQTLRELYLARLRQAADDMFPTTSEEQSKPIIAGIEANAYTGWSSDMWGGHESFESNLLLSYLARVRTLGDSELTRFWVEMLDTFPSRSGFDGRVLAFEREAGRYALGLPFSSTVETLTPMGKLVLEDLRGGANVQMADTWASWEKELPSRERIEEIEQILVFLTRGNISPDREAAIRTELGIEQTPGEETDLRWELRTRFRRSLDAHYGTENWAMRRELGKAKDALRTNIRAQELRRDRGLPTVDLYPDNQAELDELMAPSLAFLCEKLPAKCSAYRPEPTIATP